MKFRDLHSQRGYWCMKEPKTPNRNCLCKYWTLNRSSLRKPAFVVHRCQMGGDYERIMNSKMQYYVYLSLDSQRDQFTNTKHMKAEWDMEKTEMCRFSKCKSEF